MAYTPYNQYMNPYMPYYPQPVPEPAQMRQNAPQQPPGQSFAWVDSEQAAKDWVVLPGQSMLLMSRNDPVFWVKATDQSGMPQPMRAFEFTERQSAAQRDIPAPAVEYVTRPEYNALAARLEALEGKKCSCKTKKEDPENG